MALQVAHGLAKLMKCQGLQGYLSYINLRACKTIWRSVILYQVHKSHRDRPDKPVLAFWYLASSGICFYHMSCKLWPRGCYVQETDADRPLYKVASQGH